MSSASAFRQVTQSSKGIHVRRNVRSVVPSTVTQVRPSCVASGSEDERTSSPKRRAAIPLLVELAVTTILTLTLVAYILLGDFARYVADDFGTALAVRLRGFWSESIANYRLQDGRFLATALEDLAGMLNEALPHVLPGILITAWVVLLTLALRYIEPGASRLERLVISTGIVYTTLRVSPNPFLALYWMTASLAYVVPLLLAAVLAWLICCPGAQGSRRVLVITGAGLVAFLAAGEDETYTAAQTVALALLGAVALSRPSAVWRQKLPVLAAAWSGSLAGLIVMAVAPGNAIRGAAIARIVGPRPSLLSLPGHTFNAMQQFLITLFGTNWGGLLAMAIVAALVGARSGVLNRSAVRSALITTALATAGAIVVLLAAIAPAVFVEGGLPAVYG
jgi:hypothetical protein